MSNNNYYTSSRKDKKLPPLREHLSDVFGPTQGPGAYSSRSFRTESPVLPSRSHVVNSHDGDRGVSHHPSHSSHTSHAHSSYPQQLSSSRTYTHSRNEVESPRYEYGLFSLNNASRQLVQEKSSSQDNFPLKHPRTPQDPSKRHLCSRCGERFDKPTSLETHMRKHTGEKPFECPYHGCGKTFSVLSNMRRHERTHYAKSAFEPLIEDDSAGDLHHGASSPTRLSTSSYPAQYFSSTRRN